MNSAFILDVNVAPEDRGACHVLRGVLLSPSKEDFSLVGLSK